MPEHNIAIIGGAGFIGNRLAKRFDKNATDYGIYDIDTTSDLNITYLDVELPNSLDQLGGINSIINLAAVHRDDVRPLSRYEDVNVNGARNVCNAARKHGINQIIFTSSVAIYGFAPADTDESGEPNYFNEYGRTKFLAEDIYKVWQKEDPRNRILVIIRPTVVFGEGNRGNVYNLMRQIASKKFIMFGSGKNKKSMAYVENIAAFLEFSLEFKSGIHIFNYVDKPDFDMNSIVSKIREILFLKNNVGLRLPSFVGIFIGYFFDFLSKTTKKSFPVSSIRIKKFCSRTQFSSSISSTGFIPPIDLEKGLTQTINYEFLEDNSNKKVYITE